MTGKDLIAMYDKLKERYGSDAYKYISQLLREAKDKNKQDWLKHPSPSGDHEQSWKPFKGHNLENLILYIIEKEVKELGLKIVKGSKFERARPENLSEELQIIKRNLAIDFGDYGFHVPDIDLVIYNPENKRVIAVLSSKATLRERIAQTGYWKIKMSNYTLTKHIKVFFITPDEDGTLTVRYPTKKGRAIVEVDTDGSYVLTETDIEESSKVKMFDKFIEDLRRLLK